MIKLSGPAGSGPIEFRPTSQDVRLYVCGVTPYDASHLGHVATFLTYDILVRRLRQLGYRTRLVRNITDLDDPIAPKALQLGVPYAELVEAEVAEFRRDMDQLGMLRPDAERWFDRLIWSLDDFDLTVTFCFTPESHGLRPHHTSPPRDVDAYADFCAAMTRRYAS